MNSMERKPAKRKNNMWKKLPHKQKIAVGILAGAAVLLLALLVFSLCASGESLPAVVSSPQSHLPDSAASGQELDVSYNKDEFSVDLSEFKGVLLEESSKAGQTYLNETVFVGDSNTGRLYGYEQVDLQNTVYFDGIGIQSVPYEPCIYFYGMDEGVSMPKAIALMKPRRIVMNFGTNNADGTTSPEAFISYYRTALKAIEAAYPDAEIIISSIAPMAKYRSYNNISMKVVDSFNLALMEMAKEDGYRFLNAAEELKNNQTGYIKDAYISSDGLHFSQAGCKAYIDYFLRHASDAPDKRTSKPKDVPQRRLAPAQTVSSSEESSSLLASVAVKFTVQTQNAKGELLSTEQGGYLTSPDGGTTQYIMLGEKSKLMVANAMDGYTFAGWYRGSEQITTSKELYYKVSGQETEDEIILKAVFVKKVSTVPLNYVVGEGGTLVSLTTDAATKNTTCTVAAQKGYVFIGWSDGVASLTRTDAPVSSAMTVTAQFKKEAPSSSTEGTSSSSSPTPSSSTESVSSSSSSEPVSSSEAPPVPSDTTSAPSSDTTPSQAESVAPPDSNATPTPAG